MWESENQDESPFMTTDNFHGIDRLGWWETEHGEFAEAAVNAAKAEYGVKEPNLVLDVKKTQARRYDWLLMFKLPAATSQEWMKVDFVVPVHKSEAAFEKDFPF
jgi:hypothetical protein